MKPFFLLILCLTILSPKAYALPAGFVYLNQIDSSIIQEMRYAGWHNFVGRPIKGYMAGTCILTPQAAEALHKVQLALQANGLSLKVYDCYRPQMAVDDFIAWSYTPDHQMKAEFYPHVDKVTMFQQGYVARQSSHTRGSTMDLTIIPLPVPSQATYRQGQKLVACTAPYAERFHDNSIDMGTGFDCMDTRSHPDNTAISITAYQHRIMLQRLMIKNGFQPYPQEWWHFTLKNEPFPDTYFNFIVR